MIRIADDIYTWRVVNKLTQQEAADLANVSLKTWARWERSECYPREEHYNTLRWLIAQPPYGPVAPAGEGPA